MCNKILVKNIVQVEFIIFTACIIILRADASSATPQSTIMRFSLQSGRNQTGYWITEVQLEHEANMAIISERSWRLDVEHSVTTPDDGNQIISIGTKLSSPPTRPTPGYELFPGMGYYKMHTVGQQWSEALEICAKEGAHLAVINSEQETEILRTLFGRHPRLDNVSEQSLAFIGYHDLYKEGEFVTVLGAPLNSTGFMRWADPTQPNNAKAGPDADSDCGGISRNGGLNDVPCRWNLAFFCEQEI